jgi:transcriptional antiterminator NusG
MEDQQASTMESEEAGTAGSDVESQMPEEQISEEDAALGVEVTDLELGGDDEEVSPEQVDLESEDGEDEQADAEEGEDSDSEVIEESAPEAPIADSAATSDKKGEPIESPVEELDLDAEAPVQESEAEATAELEEQVLTEVQTEPNGNEGQSPTIAEELATEAEAEVLGSKIAEPDDGREWYVVHCYSGYENKVQHNLEQRIETMDMKDKIFDVVVPTEEEMEVRDGKRRTVERRVFPGYILVQMIMGEDSWYVVRNTPGVTGFVGMGNEPTPLRPEEVSQIVKRMEADAPRIKVTYDVGQKVRIIDGPFNDFIGTVDDIDMDKAKVRVMVSFFGRDTPVELDFLQVEKA